MNLIKSNTKHCVPASFAMILNMTVDALIGRLGHDGSERIIRDVPEPECLRGFHPQEFIDILLKEGHSITMIELHPHMSHGGHVVNHATYIGEDRFFQSLLYGDGVIFGTVEDGKGHAVAWSRDEAMIYDPRGYKYRWNKDQDFQPRQFFLIQKVEEPCAMMFTTQDTDS